MRLAAVERERLAVERLPDVPERDEPERDDFERDDVEVERVLELLRVPEPEREDVLRPVEEPPLAFVLRARVERDDDEPELLEPEPEERLEPEAPRLGCGIDLSPYIGGN